MLFHGFKVKAEKKIESMDESHRGRDHCQLRKNEYQKLCGTSTERPKYRTYATPRSVNTLGGVMKDVNDDLA